VVGGSSWVAPWGKAGAVVERLGLAGEVKVLFNRLGDARKGGSVERAVWIEGICNEGGRVNCWNLLVLLAEIRVSRDWPGVKI